MVLNPFRETVKRIHRFSVSTQNRRLWTLGLNVLFVRLFAWETLFPNIVVLPVIWQIFDIVTIRLEIALSGARFIPDLGVFAK
jgi:hypothetical protein